MFSKKLNPLLVKSTIVRSVATGREGRSSKRFKRTQKVEIKMFEIIQIYLPCLAYLPTNVEAYTEELKSLLAATKQEFLSAGEHEIARRYLAHFIEKGNLEGAWSLEPPELLIKLRRHRQMRTLRWHKKTAKCSLLKNNFEFMLQNPNVITNLTAHELLSLIVVCSGLYGGLCQANSMVALANKLQDSNPIYQSSFHGHHLAWINLIIENSEINNTYINDKPVRIHRWFIDSVSLGLIVQTLDKLENTSAVIYTETTIFRVIRETLKKLNIPFPFRTLKSYSQISVSVVENLPGINISSALTEAANGRNLTVSLPGSFWNQTIIPIAHNIQPIDFNCYTKSHHTTRSTKSKNRSDTDKSILDIYNLLTISLQIKDKHGQKATKYSALNKLQSLDTTHWCKAANYLRLWYQYQLEVKGLKVSAVKRYHSEIGKQWLMADRKFNFSTLDSSEFFDIYIDIIEKNKTIKRQQYQAGRLESLHYFVSEKFDIASLNEALSVGGSRYIMVRAGYITKLIFDSVLEYLGQITGLDSNSKASIQVLFIVAYRTGLRLSDLVKLQLSDVEYSFENWLFIRNNKYGDNKSNATMRKLPLRTLLTKQEYDLFYKYLRLRQQISSSRKELFFCRDGLFNEPWNDKLISKIISDALKLISGLPSLTFHHLRHTALSNMHIIIEREWELASSLTGYEPEQIENIFKAICGSSHEQLRIYWCLACFAGHSSPATTFQSYLHFSDLITHLKIQKNTQVFTINQCKAISSLSANKLTRICNQYSINPEKIKIETLRPSILKKLSKWTGKYIHTPKDTTQTPRLPKNVIPFRTAISHNVTYKVLKDFEEGFFVPDLVYGYHVSEEKILHWIDNAKKLKSLKTREGASRLISSSREKINDKILLPSKLKDKDEKSDSEKLFLLLRDIYKSNKKSIHAAVRYYISMSNSSSAGIRFTDKNKLKAFMKMLILVIPLHRWKVIIQANKSIDEKKLIRHWKIDEKLNLAIERKSKYAAKHKGTAYLFLKHPSERELLTHHDRYHKYSARTLRYVMHMIAIMVFNDEDFKLLNNS